MSAFDDMLTADRDAIFLNLAEFAEEVLHLPDSDANRQATVTAVFEEDRLQGTNEFDGDGVRPDTQKGTRIRNSGTLHLSAAIAVDEDDWFVIHGRKYAVKRQLGTDGVMQRLLVVNVKRDSTKTIRPAWRT